MSRPQPATTTDGSAPDAAAVQANLNTIPALTGNVTVTGNAGGPYTITFTNALTGLNVNQLDNPAVTGGVTAAVATATNGSTPDAAAVQAALNAIPALSGNVEVLGVVGGPYTIVFTNGLAGLAAAQLTAAVTGGVTATPATLTAGGFTAVTATLRDGGGASTALTTLTTNAGGMTTISGGTVETSGDQTFNDAVNLGNNSVLTAGTGNISFNSTLDGTFALAANSSGTTTFGGNVGSTTPLTEHCDRRRGHHGDQHGCCRHGQRHWSDLQ